MCEIQIIQKLGENKIDRADMGEFFKMMCFGSMGNNDAFGFFNNDTTFKQSGAFDASKINEYDLTDSSFIVGHNRLSTGCVERVPIVNKKKVRAKLPPISQNKKTLIRRPASWNWSNSFADNMFNIFIPTCGWGRVYLENDIDIVPEEVPLYDDNQNNHPFELGDFLLVHNGIISNAQALCEKYNFKGAITTDSYIILELIEYFFKKDKKKMGVNNRINRISMAIQKTCEKLHGGYSVVLYDKATKKTFYFKNIFQSFHLCKYGDKVLCGSTAKDNLDYLYFGMGKERISIKSSRVYLITSDIKNPVVDITQRIFKQVRTKVLYNILLKENDFIKKTNKVEDFLGRTLGYIPLYKFTRKGDLKIATNNLYGIKESIYRIVEKPRKRFGWYVIKVSDIQPKLKKKSTKKQIKLYKLKGGKK